MLRGRLPHQLGCSQPKSSLPSALTEGGKDEDGLSVASSLVLTYEVGFHAFSLAAWPLGLTTPRPRLVPVQRRLGRPRKAGRQRVVDSPVPRLHGSLERNQRRSVLFRKRAGRVQNGPDGIEMARRRWCGPKGWNCLENGRHELW